MSTAKPFGVRHWHLESNQDVTLPERFASSKEAAEHAWNTAQECIAARPKQDLVRGRFADNVVRVSINHDHTTICTHRVVIIGG